MIRFALELLRFIILALLFATAHAQQFGDPFAEQARKADSTGLALGFLELERLRISIDLVRNHSNTNLVVGGESVNQSNVGAFSSENERKLQVISDEMKQRGFVMAGGEYNVEPYFPKQGDKFRACTASQQSVGPVVVVQDGRTIEFRDATGKLSGYGVIVQSSIAVVPGARDQVSPQVLIGALASERMTLWLYQKGSPALISGAPSICQLSFLVRKAASQEQVRH